jgi:hypothetical protein
VQTQYHPHAILAAHPVPIRKLTPRSASALAHTWSILLPTSILTTSVRLVNVCISVSQLGSRSNVSRRVTSYTERVCARDVYCHTTNDALRTAVIGRCQCAKAFLSSRILRHNNSHATQACALTQTASLTTFPSMLTVFTLKSTPVQ